MEKDEVVSALREMADLLEITGANKFEYLAIRSGAQGLEDWSGDLKQTAADNQLTEIPSVGKGIAATIAALVQHGQSSEYDRVRNLVPPELPKLLKFRGLGPKRIKMLWQDLGVESPDQLEKATQDGRVQELKGFGPKMVEKILSSIEYFRNADFPTKPIPQLQNVPTALKANGRMLAGMSGYSYPKWKSKTDMLLDHYSDKLATVEINNTFYRFPSEKVVNEWKSQTPENFQFAFKAHRRVTHQMRLSPGTRIRIQEFVERCSVLESRLGCILFQLPPDFERDDTRLETLLGSLPSGPRYAVEFRHASWMIRYLTSCVTTTWHVYPVMQKMRILRNL